HTPLIVQLYFMFLSHPTSTLFPYTTLFRSLPRARPARAHRRPDGRRGHARATRRARLGARIPARRGRNPPHRVIAARARRCRDRDRKSTRLNSSHLGISYAVFCLKKKNQVH